MKKDSKVEIQKGKINPNPMTMKQQTHRERVEETIEQNAFRRYGQYTDLHEPKNGRK